MESPPPFLSAMITVSLTFNKTHAVALFYGRLKAKVRAIMMCSLTKSFKAFTLDNEWFKTPTVQASFRHHPL